MTKLCSKCKTERPLAQFSPQATTKDKLKSICKPCNCATALIYYKTHRENYKTYARVYMQSRENKDRANTRRNELRRKRPELTLLRLASLRAKRSGVPFNLEIDDIRIPERCPVLGLPLKWGCAKRQLDCSPTIDKKIPRLGYVKGNIAVISWRANRIKSDATPEELKAVADYAADHLTT